LLQQHYADQEQTDNDVNHNQKIDHRDCFGTSKLLGCGGMTRRGPDVSGKNLDLVRLVSCAAA
jgi:hypothetical protein